MDLGVLTVSVPRVFPGVLLPPPSVLVLTVDVVDTNDVVLARGTGGISSSEFTLLNEPETPEALETRELGRDKLDARELRGMGFARAGVVVDETVPLRGSALAFTVLLLLGLVAEVGLVGEVLSLRMVDVVDLTDAAIDFGLPAAGLSVADVVLLTTVRRAGTFRAGASDGSELVV